MTRKLMVPLFAAMMLVLLVSAAAFAADVPSVSPCGAVDVYFVDADGDGVCDNTGLYLGQANGVANQRGSGVSQAGYGSCLDADGDGVCDYTHTQPQPGDGTGRQNGAGGRRP